MHNLVLLVHESGLRLHHQLLHSIFLCQSDAVGKVIAWHTSLKCLWGTPISAMCSNRWGFTTTIEHVAKPGKVRAKAYAEPAAQHLPAVRTSSPSHRTSLPHQQANACTQLCTS